MKRLLIVLVLALTGCANNIPIVPPFPSIPDSLRKSCPDLKPIDAETTKLSEVLTAVTDNYRQYYDCKSQVDDWLEWYTTQKGIFDKIK